MPHDPLIRQGLSDEIVSAYRALAHLHRALLKQSHNDDEIAMHDYQADILDQQARLWHLRLCEAARMEDA